MVNNVSMSKFKIVNLIDKIFVSCCVFLIIYAWINFYLRDLWITFVLSLIFSAATLFLLYYFLNKKKNKAQINQKQAADINTQFLIFKLNTTNKKLDLLKEILSKNYLVNYENQSIVYTKDNLKHLIGLADQLDVVNNQNIIPLINEFTNANVDVIEIICNEVDSNLNSKIFLDKTMIFTNKKKLYLNYFLKHNLFPDATNINLKSNKLKFTDIVKNMFIPQKAKSYFFCGLILIFSSIILPYHFY